MREIGRYWIEEAEARRFDAVAMANCNVIPPESHYLHFGKSIAKVPWWFHDSVSCTAATAILKARLSELRGWRRRASAWLLSAVMTTVAGLGEDRRHQPPRQAACLPPERVSPALRRCHTKRCQGALIDV